LTAELRRKDEDAVVGAIVIIPALLDPGTQLLEEKPDVNDELITSEEHQVGDRIGQGSNHHDPSMLILANKRCLQLLSIESSHKIGLADEVISWVSCLRMVEITVDVGVTQD